MSRTLHPAWEMVILLYCLIMLALVMGDSSEEKSEDEYYFAIMQFNPPGYDSNNFKLNLVISNPSNKKVEAKVKEAGGSEVKHKIYSSDTKSVPLSADLNLHGSGKHTKHVRVKVKRDSYLQVHMEYVSDSPPISVGGGFTLLPKNELKKEYVVVTHCVTGNCILLVTSVQNGEKVDVKLNITPSNEQADYDGKKYSDGGTIPVTGLKAGESIQVICGGCDLTGTTVTSDKKGVVVVAGGELTKLVAGDADSDKDMVIEQMMPTETLGQKYVLGYPDAITNFGSGSNQLNEVIKVVPTDKGTTFYFDYACYTGQEVYIFERKSGRVLELLADNPVLVAQFLRTGVRSDNHGLVMTLPLPFRQWEKTYEGAYTPPLGSADAEYERVYLNAVASSTGVHDLTVTPNSQSSLASNFSKPPYEVSMIQFKEELLRKVKCDKCEFSSYIVHDRKGRSLSFAVRKPLSKLSKKDKDGVKAACEAITTAASRPDTTVAQTTQAKPTTTSADITTQSDVTTSTKSQVTTAADTTVAQTTPTTSTQTTPSTTSADVTTQSDVTTSTKSQITTAADTSVAQTTPTTSTQTTPSITSTDVTTQSDITTDAVSQGVTTSSSGSANTAPATTHQSSASASPGSTSSSSSSSSSSSPGQRRNLACCHCANEKAKDAVSPAELEQQKEEAKAAIQKELTMDKKELSSFTRKKESSPDERVSAAVIGTSLGISIFSLVFVFLVGFDAVRVVRYLVDYSKNWRKIPEPSEERTSEKNEMEMATVVPLDSDKPNNLDSRDEDVFSWGTSSVYSADSAPSEDDCDGGSDRADDDVDEYSNENVPQSHHPVDNRDNCGDDNYLVNAVN